MTIEQLLRGNAYPGRGILLGQAPSGASVLAYFIMGRSANSRNRVFTPTGDGIRTEAKDPARLEDPSLIIYHPVRTVGDRTIVANGDQSDTIRGALLSGGTFEDALRTRTFEPDAPHWTPRISGLLEPDGAYRLSILKRCGDGCCRQFFEYPPQPGVGHFLSTYQHDGDPLPSFAGEPVPVELTALDTEALAASMWEALDRDNRVALFVRFLDPSTGSTETRIVNQYGGGLRRKETL